MTNLRNVLRMPDMLKLGAESFTRAIATLGMLEGVAISVRENDAVEMKEYEDALIEPEIASIATEAFTKLLAEVNALGAPVTKKGIERALERIRDGKCRNADLRYFVESNKSRLFDELSGQLVFVLGPKHADYFATSDFGHAVADQFPLAAYDMDEAMKCLALGRSTASVFHMMRVMEAALRAIRLCLGLDPETNGPGRNWGQIANAIRLNIKERGNTFAEKDLFSEMYALLDAVKDAWRNSTMHVDDKKTEDEAEAILLAVRGFMKKVAARMNEEGLPLA